MDWNITISPEERDMIVESLSPRRNLLLADIRRSDKPSDIAKMESKLSKINSVLAKLGA